MVSIPTFKTTIDLEGHSHPSKTNQTVSQNPGKTSTIAMEKDFPSKTGGKLSHPHSASATPVAGKDLSK